MIMIQCNMRVRVSGTAVFMSSFWIFCAFLRVALKDLHHTRVAMSTAKSIRDLSVQKISYNMKL